MDQLSRDLELQTRLEQAPEWDLVVFDESHRMSAHYFGSEVKRTKRYDMGKRVGNHARNLLLMTATPHNGKDEDFQLFMALLDEDRFAGQQKDAVHRSDPTDLMRRLVKEDLYTFAGTKLFPERRSYTAESALSEPEKVTEYVREEMNRADRNAQAEGGGKKRVNVGFALMTLQRRLASSPFAIHPSLARTAAGAAGEQAEGRTSAAGGPRGGQQASARFQVRPRRHQRRRHRRALRGGNRRRSRSHRRGLHRQRHHRPDPGRAGAGDRNPQGPGEAEQEGGGSTLRREVERTRSDP